MKVILGVGALLTLLFWGVVLSNVLEPFAQPFSVLLNIAAAVVAVVHIAELWYFKSTLQQSSTPGLSRLKVLVLGIFHGYTLTRNSPSAASVVEPCAVAVTVAHEQSQAISKIEPEGDSHLQLQMQFEPMAEPQHA
ncbi:DUF1145 domain-containing protein [Pseudomonas sp. NPDC078700]|uniref:DUF1145 domain-containing protein n=1 Tax=Pseudomonas sp. NPDC078700 TaxID=3364424 RepID=UPI0037CCB214